MDAVVLLFQASGCCVTATAPLSPSGCSELVTFKIKFWTPISNFSIFTQKASTQVHESLSVAGGPAGFDRSFVGAEVYTLTRLDCGCSHFGREPCGGNREPNCFPEGKSAPETRTGS